MYFITVVRLENIQKINFIWLNWTGRQLEGDVWLRESIMVKLFYGHKYGILCALNFNCSIETLKNERRTNDFSNFL